MPSSILYRLTCFAMVAWIDARAQTTSPAAPLIQTCESITLAKPGEGVAYKGTVRNDDYRVKIAIPDKLTGWGGVAPEAPFHGFVIFHPGSLRTCIGLYVELRVDLGDRGLAERHHAGKKVTVGNRRGWEDDRSGVLNGTALTNVTIILSVPQHHEIFDYSIWLVTPNEDVDKEIPVFRKFVSGLDSTRFYGERGIESKLDLRVAQFPPFSDNRLRILPETRDYTAEPSTGSVGLYERGKGLQATIALHRD